MRRNGLRDRGSRRRVRRTGAAARGVGRRLRARGAGGERAAAASFVRGFGYRSRAPAAAGALALRRSRDGFSIDAVKPRGLDRPWSPGVAGEGEAETTILVPRQAAPRSIDATPAEADVQADE